MTDVNKTFFRAMGVSAATIALMMIGYGAQAQQKAPQPSTTPSATTTAAKTTKSDKKTDKKASQCKGLEQEACAAKADECSWVAASTTKLGKEIKAYCRTKPKAAAARATKAPKQ
jgi:hypothetical protein